MGNLRDYGTREDGSRMLGFWCDGCQEPHSFSVDCKGGQRPCWTWNGDWEKPTFNPSLLYPSKTVRCHLYVTDGQIQYLSDCDHHLAGKTVPIPPFPYPV